MAHKLHQWWSGGEHIPDRSLGWSRRQCPSRESRAKDQPSSRQARRNVSGQKWPWSQSLVGLKRGPPVCRQWEPSANAFWGKPVKGQFEGPQEIQVTLEANYQRLGRNGPNANPEFDLKILYLRKKQVHFYLNSCHWCEPYIPIPCTKIRFEQLESFAFAINWHWTSW